MYDWWVFYTDLLIKRFTIVQKDNLKQKSSCKIGCYIFHQYNYFPLFQTRKNFLLKSRRAPHSGNFLVVPNFLCPKTLQGGNKWNPISNNREKLVILARGCPIFHFPMGFVRNKIVPRT